MAYSNKRNCLIQDHLHNLVSDICIYPRCDRENRWVCIDCMKESIHSHGQANTKHIINSSQSVARLKQNVDNLKKEDCKYQSQRIKQIKEILNQIIIIAQENLKIMEKLDPQTNIRHQIEYQNYLIQKIDKEGYFQEISNEDVNILVGYQTNEYIKEKPIIKLIRDLDEQVQKIRDNQNKKYINEQIEDHKYNEIITIHQQNTQVTCAVLSFDELILAYVTDKKLTLISTFSQLKHLIDNTYPITCCQFTQCQKYIMYGDQNGNIYKTPLNLQNLNTFTLQVCKTPITNIVSRNIQNTFISNNINQLIKICLETNKYQFEVKLDLKIDGFDYSQSLNIVSIISYKTIQLRDGSKGTIQLTQQDSHSSQINQMLTSHNQLFTLDQFVLKIWNMENKTLSQCRLISAEQQIFNFSLIDDGNKIIFICQNKVIIKDFNNNQIKEYEHTNKIQSIYIDNKDPLTLDSLIRFNFFQLSKVIIYYFEDHIQFFFKGKIQIQSK